jgi:hypothetical protein
MSATDLKKWMESNNKSVVDVSSMTKIGTDTIRDFLKGEHVSPRTVNHLELFVRVYSMKTANTAA